MRALAALIPLLVAATAAAGPLWSERGGRIEIDSAILDGVVSKHTTEATIALGADDLVLEVLAVPPANLGVERLRGRFAGAPETYFLLCRADREATVALFLAPDGSTYKLGREDGVLAVRQVDPITQGSCAGGVASRDLPRPSRDPHPAAEPFRGLPKAEGVADDGSRHDAIIGYTPAAATYLGGEAAIRAEAQLAVDAANLAYANSLVDSRLRLVHVMPTDYDEALAWSYEDHVYYLYDPDDGAMDDVLVMRDRVGADFATVLVDGRDSLGDVRVCGIAPVMQSDDVNQTFEQYAISVVSVQCAADAWSYAHEVGHNRGCAHNREDASLDGAYPYAYGHRFDAGGVGYRTVMSYDDASAGFTRVPYFSNPSVDYSGEPTGIAPGLAGEAHNARVHGNTAAVCAAFRAERTFVQFGWGGASTGFFDAPFAGIPEAQAASRAGGHIALLNGNTVFQGTLDGPSTYVSGATGSVVLGGN